MKMIWSHCLRKSGCNWEKTADTDIATQTTLKTLQRLMFNQLETFDVADKNPPRLSAPLHQTSQIRPILSEPMFSKLMFVILSCSCGTVVDHKPLNQEVASLILASMNFKVVPNKGAILLIFSEKWMPSSSS